MSRSGVLQHRRGIFVYRSVVTQLASVQRRRWACPKARTLWLVLRLFKCLHSYHSRYSGCCIGVIVSSLKSFFVRNLGRFWASGDPLGYARSRWLGLPAVVARGGDRFLV